MKKFFTSLVFLVAFITYGFYQYAGNSNTIEYIASKPIKSVSITQRQNTPILDKPKTSTVLAQTHSSEPTSSIPIPTTPPPKSIPKNQYTDGTYTGSVADAYYGNVQVQSVISNGRITDVVFLQYPNDRSTSRYINGFAMPALTKEAIKIQNAKVNIVSGASDTSGAFQDSLSNALAQAKN